MLDLYSLLMHNGQDRSQRITQFSSRAWGSVHRPCPVLSYLIPHPIYNALNDNLVQRDKGYHDQA